MDPSSSTDFNDEIDGEDDEVVLMNRRIKCPIHDHIPISPKLAQFIDTRQFQRLRRIKQLGTTSYVWPSATHTRFEHCIGVAHLARSLASHLRKSQPRLGITERDVECVEIAGLCHDLGHGPWSHVWDGLFMPAALKDRKVKWTHEEGSELMFDALIEENGIQCPEEDQAFIKALIAGDHSRTPHEKPFLFDIVANKRNGFDVDKFDYIHRDSHMTGDRISFSLTRLIESARVIDRQICYNIKDVNHIYDICAYRFKLHKMVYNHKAAKAIEYMIIDALLSAEPYMQFANRVFDKEQYIFLTDDIMHQIEASTAPELAEARSILRRIHTRDLYKCVDYKVAEWSLHEVFREHVTPARIVEAVRALNMDVPPLIERSDSSSSVSTLEDEETLQVDDVIVDFSVMHHGMKERNPLDYVKFYGKMSPKTSMGAGPGTMSNLLPACFAEVLLRVYTRKQKFYGLVQAGYRALLAELSLQASQPADGSHIAAATSSTPTNSNNTALAPSITIVPTVTPPLTDSEEAPSTPKPHSRSASFTLPPGTTGTGSGTAVTPFSNNEFTTVPASFAPASPTQAGKAKGRKRSRDEAATTVTSTLKKRKA